VLVKELFLEPSHRWPSIVSGDERYWDAAVIKRLLEQADLDYDTNPLRGLLLTDMAADACERLRIQDRDVPSLRYTAYKERSTYQRRFGRFTNALSDIDAAESALHSGDPSLGSVQRATLHYARALVYAEPDFWQPERAIQLLDEAEPVFLAASPERARAAVFLRGAVYERSGNVYAALRIWHALAESAESESGDYADVARSIAACYAVLGQVQQAGQWCDEALRLNAQRGMTSVSYSKALLVQGHVLSAMERYLDALGAYTQSEQMFSAFGMEDTALRVALAGIRVRLLIDSAADVRARLVELANRSAALDVKEKHRRPHVTAEAFDYLRRYSESQPVTVDVVVFVERFLDDITSRAVYRFVAPIPPRVM